MDLVATDPRNPAPSSLAVRSVMRANRGSDTGPERVLRQHLRQSGLVGYRINRRIGPVRPDVVFGRARVAIFVHGCYWHRCPTCAFPLPKTNRRFWATKFVANRARDERVRSELTRLGWSVIVVWGHELKRPTSAISRITAALARRSSKIRPTRGGVSARPGTGRSVRRGPDRTRRPNGR